MPQRDSVMVMVCWPRPDGWEPYKNHWPKDLQYCLEKYLNWEGSNSYYFKICDAVEAHDLCLKIMKLINFFDGKNRISNAWDYCGGLGISFIRMLLMGKEEKARDSITIRTIVEATPYWDDLKEKMEG